MALALEHRDFWEVEVDINLDVEHATLTTRSNGPSLRTQGLLGG